MLTKVPHNIEDNFNGFLSYLLELYKCYQRFGDLVAVKLTHASSSCQTTKILKKLEPSTFWGYGRNYENKENQLILGNERFTPELENLTPTAVGQLGSPVFFSPAPPK